MVKGKSMGCLVYYVVFLMFSRGNFLCFSRGNSKDSRGRGERVPQKCNSDGTYSLQQVSSLAPRPSPKHGKRVSGVLSNISSHIGQGQART